MNPQVGRGTANLQALKKHLTTGDPLLLAVPVYSGFFRVNPYQPVIGTPRPGSAFYGGYAVTVVGYDDAIQIFQFVNSWGRGWGDHGYACLSYDFVQQYAWEAWALVDGDTTPPELPDRAYGLGGAENDVAQSEIGRPVFVWEASDNPKARYQVYWEPAANGTGNTTITEALLSPQAVSQTSTLAHAGPGWRRQCPPLAYAIHIPPCSAGQRGTISHHPAAGP